VSLEARFFTGLDRFAALAGSWDALVHEAGLDPLCNAHGWTLSHARAFTPDEDAFGWTLHEGGETVGVLALRREPVRGTLALRRALFLADGSFDSDYLASPVRPGFERAAVQALLTHARDVPGLEAVVLSGIPDDSPFLAALRTELEARGLPRREHAVPCLVATLQEDLEATIATLKSRMRSKVRAAVRAAQAAGLSLRWCERTGELDAHLEDLFRLHELRWQSIGETGGFADHRRREFYRALAQDALPRGTLRLARLEKDGRAQAVQLGLLADGRYYQIQEGYDPAHESERVGVALRALAVERLIAEGVRTYDYLAGDSRHKRDWGAVVRPTTTVAFPLEKWRARLAYGARRVVDRWKAARAD
jgi:CelD/BcsL family acetyltransferase involved in cellulose biosynthesis